MCDAASWTVTTGARSANALRIAPGIDGAVAVRTPWRRVRCQARYSRSGEVTSTTVAAMPSSAELGRRGQHFRHDGAAADEVYRRSAGGRLVGGVDEPVPAGQDLPPQDRVAEPVARGLERLLVDAARGQPEVIRPGLSRLAAAARCARLVDAGPVDAGPGNSCPAAATDWSAPQSSQSSATA